MTSLEKYLWTSFTATLAFLTIYIVMIAGAKGGLETAPYSLFGVYFAVVLGFTLTHIAAALIFLAKNQRKEDERDHAIELKGYRNGYYTLFGVINLILIAVLVSLNLSEGEHDKVLLMQPQFIFHALFLGTFLIHGVETGTRLYYYRRGLA